MFGVVYSPLYSMIASCIVFMRVTGERAITTMNMNMFRAKVFM